VVVEVWDLWVSWVFGEKVVEEGTRRDWKECWSSESVHTVDA
jgi:hypothetical protein